MTLRKPTAAWTLSVLWLTLCGVSTAQTPSGAQEAIKKALQAGQLDQAARLIQQERERSPKDVQMRFMEGVVQAQKGQTDKAIDTFKQITVSNPDLSEAYNNLGVLYAAKGQLEESRSYLEKALLTHPSYAAAHRNLSDVHSQLAKQSYAKALQVDPKAKQSPPQLTLLGSIGPEKRSPPSHSPVVAAVKPPIANKAASAPASTPAQTPTPAPTTIALPASSAPSAVSASVKPVAPLPASSPTATASAPPVKADPPTLAKAAPVAETPATDNSKAEEMAIQSAVTAWAKAWSQKDMTRYLGAYAEAFTPSENMSRARWESDRRARIVFKKSIAVGINQMQITRHGTSATVRFQQIYESDNLKVTSHKSLEMKKLGNHWLIMRETVN